MASISEPFIRRAIGTTLLAVGLFQVGTVAYAFLPVSAVPKVDFPMIRAFAKRPGADPAVMAATVAAPLERRLGQIAGIEQITSTDGVILRVVASGVVNGWRVRNAWTGRLRRGLGDGADVPA